MNVSRFSRFPRLHSFKFTPFALISLFLFYNLTGFFFSSAFAPAVRAVPAPSKKVSAPYIPADIPTSGDTNLDLVILRAGERHGVDPRLLHAVIWQESKYKLRAKSGAGAQGYMQLIPATAARFDCQDVYDPVQNIEAGTKYLRWLLDRFDGNVVLALAGYNAGEGAVDKYDGVPPYNETQNYVRIITSRYGKTFHPMLEPSQARVQFNLVQEQEVAQLVAAE